MFEMIWDDVIPIRASMGPNPKDERVRRPAGIEPALRSATRRSAEEWVTGDWAAVADAVKQRMTQLDLRQGDVIKRSGLTKQTVGEIENNSKQRNRNRRTLEALSEALEWHPDHLAAVLEGRTPPEVGTPYAKSAEDIPKRFDILEHRIETLRAEIVELESSLDDRFNELRKDILASFQQALAHMRRPGR
jgi:transcriptional regulator with XRE-family HTH domain